MFAQASRTPCTGHQWRPAATFIIIIIIILLLLLFYYYYYFIIIIILLLLLLLFRLKLTIQSTLLKYHLLVSVYSISLQSYQLGNAVFVGGFGGFPPNLYQNIILNFYLLS